MWISLLITRMSAPPPKKGGTVSQRAWHDKHPSLRKGDRHYMAVLMLPRNEPIKQSIN